jgi:hypothetical protein
MKLNFKKCFQFLAIILCAMSVAGQPVTSRFQGGFDYTGNTISFKLRADITGNANFANIEYFVRVPDAAPVFTWGTLNENVANFPGMGNFVLDPAPPTVPGFRIYHFFYTAPEVITTSASYTGGTTYEVFNVTINVDPGTLSMQMVHSAPDEDPFYFSATDGIGQDLRFPAATSYFFPSTNSAGDPYFVNLTLATAPAFLKEFNVTKQGNNNALLSWTTTQEFNVSHFILERSWSQTSGWTFVGEVKAKGNSNTPSSYSFTDPNVYDGRSAAKVAFYRIRVLDIDQTEKYFPVRSLRFSATGAKEIGIYPNPAKDGFTITIPLVNPNSNAKLRLNLVNRLGQTVHAREINSMAASNYYYDIKTPGVISGEYMLQIIYEGEILDTKKIIVQR